MYLSISTDQRVDLRNVKAERTDTGAIWLRQKDGAYSLYMDDEAARELVRQLEAVLDDPKPDPLPDPRGYVFIDKTGDAWGRGNDGFSRGCASDAESPFRTHAEARAQGERCTFGCQRVEVWTPESRVPPMPEGEA